MPVCVCRVRVNHDHLRHNLALLQATGKALMPVVKADAYGHGLTDVAATLAAGGVDHLAVGSVAEAVRLRRSGFGACIVALLGAVDDENRAAARAWDIVPLVHDWPGLSRLAETEAKAEKPLRVAVKCDTGMSRLGFAVEDMARVAQALAACPGLRADMLMSHLAVADEPEEDAYTRAQAARFGEAARALRAYFPQLRLSLGNTACLLTFPDLAGDLARPGLGLYGVNPLHGTSRAGAGAGLKPVMEVSAPVLAVRPLPAGRTLGYGRTYTALTDRLVAVVGIGYADGYRRGPAPATRICLRGVRAPVIGRVAMQMTCVDITELAAQGLDIRPGDEAFVLGGPGHAVTAWDLAEQWGTIPYEVICLLGKGRA
ncbi:MAG: alanine racemase [Desulfovibrionaceae bacterium]|nr:alanine racemase [Desulfovibrionaceae bacterium]